MKSSAQHSATIPPGATLKEALDWRRRRVECSLKSDDAGTLDQEYLDGEVVDEGEFYGGSIHLTVKVDK